MNDLAQCLYGFLLERRMGRLWEDAGYRALVSNVELQEELVKSFLDEGQRRELDQLLDQVSEQDSIARTHMFQATLDLFQELAALTGQSQIAVAK